MKLHQPLHVCAYIFGIFPALVDLVGQRFRIHWPGLVFKMIHMLFYWWVSYIAFEVSTQTWQNYQKLTKTILTNRVLNIDELFIYMISCNLVSTTVCQIHLLWPSVICAINKCFLDLCSLDHITGIWQFFTAFTIVFFVIYEFVMFYIIVTYKQLSDVSPTACIFLMLSNIMCITIEQFFYLICISLYLRLQRLHKDIKSLVHKAEHPRWRFWVTPAAGDGLTSLGIPAFSALDIRNLRTVHRSCMELFAHVNRLFQLPLSLSMCECIFRIVVFVYGIAFDVTIVMWGKKEHINYINTILYSGYCLSKVIRLWILHLCEHYVNKKIVPMHLSLDCLSLVLKPVTSRRLIPEIVLFQHQLDTIKCKFEIFGLLNINMMLFYAGFGTILAYIILLLQIFAFNQISMSTISTSLKNITNN